MSKSTLSAGLKAAASITPPPVSQPQTGTASSQRSRKGAGKSQPSTVMVGANFPPEVRRVLFLVQAEPENARKTMKQLLGEAINDLCAKYRKPQPYQGED